MKLPKTATRFFAVPLGRYLMDGYFNIILGNDYISFEVKA